MIELLFVCIALTILEIVLGVDNVVMLVILVNTLPTKERRRVQYWGLTFAWCTRLLLLAGALHLMQCEQPFMTVWSIPISIRGLLLIAGGIFLCIKSTQEIYHMVTPSIQTKARAETSRVAWWWVVIQIGLMDIVFSFDSVLTAVGLTDQFWIMVLSMTIAILIMLYAADVVGRWVERYPAFKLLALSFLMLIGMVLLADGVSFHIPRVYLYVTMGISWIVAVFYTYQQR